MHVHVPKPLHGWKAFANEIFVIVIGVLIALGFEQVVEQLHWQHEIADARETLHAEVSMNLKMLQFTHANAGCQQANFGELQNRIKAGDVAGAQAFLAKMPKLSAKISYLSTTRWDLLSNSGLLAHMASEEKQTLADAYTSFEIETRYQRLRSDIINEAYGKAAVFEGTPDARQKLLEEISTIKQLYKRADDFPGIVAQIQKRTGIAPGTIEAAQERIGVQFKPCTRFDQTGNAG